MSARRRLEKLERLTEDGAGASLLGAISGSVVYLLLREAEREEAEREATPPARWWCSDCASTHPVGPGPCTPPEPAPVRDEPEVGAVVREQTFPISTWRCSVCGNEPPSGVACSHPIRMVTPARPTPAPQPDTAPDEGAVEALTRVLRDLGVLRPHERADLLLAAFRADAIPHYGPTGASGGAGEVVVRRQDVNDAIFAAIDSDRFRAARARLIAALDAS